jgi:hypothetical protein
MVLARFTCKACKVHPSAGKVHHYSRFGWNGWRRDSAGRESLQAMGGFPWEANIMFNPSLSSSWTVVSFSAANILSWRAHSDEKKPAICRLSWRSWRPRGDARVVAGGGSSLGVATVGDASGVTSCPPFPTAPNRLGRFVRDCADSLKACFLYWSIMRRLDW